MSGPELSSAQDVRWRNYHHLIRTQQQIHLQIQQQRHHHIQNAKVGSEGEASTGDTMPQTQGPLNDPSPEKPKDTSDPWENFDAHAAFLGPTLWDKRLPYDGQDFKLEYMDLEEFLTENGIPVEGGMNDGGYGGPIQKPQHLHTEEEPTQHQQGFLPSHFMAGPSRPNNVHHGGLVPLLGHHGAHQTVPIMRSLSSTHTSRSPSPTDSTSSSNLSGDVTPAVSPDSTQQNADLGLATVPGHDFDPRTRAFTDDELKPQPMIKKSKKQFVPMEQKDAKYWARRRKNNMAAKRSRDARRVKENQIAMRACYLEKENHVIKAEMERVQKENMILKEQLTRCHREH